MTNTNKKNIKAINTNSSIPDIQGLADTRNLPINKVGIKDIVHPMIINCLLYTSDAADE